MSIQPQTFAAVYHATGGYGRYDHKALMRTTIKKDLGQSGLDFDGVFHDHTTHNNVLLDHVTKVPNRTWPALVNRLTMDQMRDYLASREKQHDAELALLAVGSDEDAPNHVALTADLAQEVLGDDVEEAPKPAATPTFSLPEVDPSKQAALDAVLSGFELPTYSDIRTGVTVLSEALTASEGRPVGGGLTITLGEAKPERAGDLYPECVAVEMVNAQKVFGTRSKLLDFDVPVFQWDGVHPDVPDLIDDYVFRPKLLARVLYALVGDKRGILTGHTGTGKTTVIEQVAARLSWPVARDNMDSGRDRQDFTGGHVITIQDGVQVTEFQDGLLLQAMQAGYILILDEFDAARPDVLFALQRPMEGKGFIVTEDGGREVKPNAWFRIMATANTKGRGDEHGAYSGTRVMNSAMLDRFTVWAEVPYLTEAQTGKLLANKGVDADTAGLMASYFSLHTKAFEMGETTIPLTPRTMLEWADVTLFLQATSGKDEAFYTGFEWTMLDRCGEADRATVQGLMDRLAA
jgi:cobaltochelatase CobS